MKKILQNNKLLNGYLLFPARFVRKAKARKRQKQKLRKDCFIIQEAVTNGISQIDEKF